LNALRILEAKRERTRLQILEHARELAEQEARDTVEVAMQHKVNIEFNNQAEFIFNWLWRNIKHSWFCRNYKNAWTNICQKKIAGLKILICWHLGVTFRNMKRWIKERMSIGKWINGLNSWLLDNTGAVENDNISETKIPCRIIKIVQQLAWWGRGMIQWLLKMDGYPRQKIHRRTKQLISRRILVQPILLGGGSNNTAAISKISCPVIDVTQYSFEDQLDGKWRKIEYMVIRYNCTGPGEIEGRIIILTKSQNIILAECFRKDVTAHGNLINRREASGWRKQRRRR
jgi:hypothetical protein